MSSVWGDTEGHWTAERLRGGEAFFRGHFGGKRMAGGGWRGGSGACLSRGRWGRGS
jgi:hypothetical protein